MLRAGTMTHPYRTPPPTPPPESWLRRTFRAWLQRRALRRYLAAARAVDAPFWAWKASGWEDEGARMAYTRALEREARERAAMRRADSV